MKKYKTVNNWVCKHFIIALAIGNYRQCCFLAFNTFNECLHRDIQIRMLQYLFDCIPSHNLLVLFDSLPLEVRSYINNEYKNYFFKDSL